MLKNYFRRISDRRGKVLNLLERKTHYIMNYSTTDLMLHQITVPEKLNLQVVGCS
jgi:hypothetical protein